MAVHTVEVPTGHFGVTALAKLVLPEVADNPSRQPEPGDGKAVKEAASELKTFIETRRPVAARERPLEPSPGGLDAESSPFLA